VLNQKATWKSSAPQLHEPDIEAIYGPRDPITETIVIDDCSVLVQ
jgi:hypothetical protein